MEKKENFKAIDKMRCIQTWCDYQHDDFVAKFQTINDIERCYDACHKHGIEFADKLTWDTEDPSYVNDPQYLLAKEVNDILGIYYYKVGELTIPMLTQAKKEFVELLHKVRKINFDAALRELNGFDASIGQFKCDYKQLTVVVSEWFDDKCAILPCVKIWDSKRIVSFNETFCELLYGYGFGCLAVDGDLFTREVDVRDILGIQGPKIDVGSEKLRSYLDTHDETKKELDSNGWLPKLYVPDDVFDKDYFTLADKIRIILFAIYEDMVTCDGSEIIEDLDFYTGRKVNKVSDITDDDWLAFMKGMDDAGIRWREFVRYRAI